MRKESKEITPEDKFLQWHDRFVFVLVAIMVVIAVLDIWIHWK